MRIVPVMDVRSGRVVHAAGGDRGSYRPLASVFDVPDDPLELASWIADRWGRRLLYVADLDALAGGEPHLGTVAALAGAGHRLRVDAAVTDAAGARSLREAGAGEIAVALETLPAWSRLREVAAEVGTDRTALSLDLRGGRPVGGPAAGGAPPSSLARRGVAAGAGRILALELERVGAGGGPDLELLRACRAAAPRAGLTAAGGVRGAADVEAGARVGCDECMVATALYGGRLPPSTVRQLEGPGAADPGGRG